MGFIDNVRGLFGRPQSLLAAAAVAAATPAPPPPPTRAPTEAEGIEGGGNIHGRLFAEPNADLRDTSGYGQAGTYEVGQWVLAALGNPWVTMALDHVLRPVAAARVDVIPAKYGLDETTAKLHADFITWALTESFDLGALNKAAAHGALLSGFSLFEPLAQQLQHEGTTRWGLREVRECLPNSLDPSNPWPIDETGRLIGIGQRGPVGMSGRWDYSLLPEDRALLFSWKRAAGNFAGVSQFRSCWYTVGKAMPRLMKMVPVTLQREGPGIPVAVSTDKDSKNLTPEQRVELIEIFANMPAHENSGLVMPTGWKMDWVTSPATNKGHIVDVIERMGLWVLQQLGAQQLVIGTGTTGALSSSETHDARSMAMVVEVLMFLSRVYNGARGEADGLVKRLIDWNFGPQVAYPKVKLTPQRPELKPTELATALKTGKDAGVFTPTLEDENDFRERASLSPITEEERTKAKEAAAALAPQLQPGVEGDDQGSPGKGKPFGKKPALAASAPGGWQPWRALRASEQRVKFADIDAFFAERREEFERRVRPLVVLMLSKAAPALDAAMADGVIAPQEIAAVPLAMGPLRKALKKYTAEVRAAGAEFVRGELQRPLLAAADGDDRDVEVSKADKVVEATEELLASRIENRLRSELAREAVDVLRTGGDANEVWTRAVQRQIDTGAFKADAGTITAKVFSVGREEAARMLGGVSEVEVSALLDKNTCEVCVRLDGTRAEFGSDEDIALTPPMRDCEGQDQCRCLKLFIPARGES